MIKEGDGKENANGPTEPGINVAEGIEQPTEEEWHEAIGDGSKALGESVAAMKGAADGLREASVDGDDKEGQQKLAGLEDDCFARGKFSEVRRLALPFAPVHKTVAFADGGKEHDWEQIGGENVKDAAPGIHDAFPRAGG